MKRLVTVVTALSLVMPSIAFAQPSASAALSLSKAAVQPVRASSLSGTSLDDDGDSDTVYYVLGALFVGVVIWCVADFCKGRKSR